MCAELLPWLTLLAGGFFGPLTEAVRAAWSADIGAKHVAESPWLSPCPGTCGRVFVAVRPLTNATNVVHCGACGVSGCFRCTGGWPEDHRPATCANMARWGVALFEVRQSAGGSTSSGGSNDGADADASLLDYMYIYGNTVRCYAM